MYSSKFRRVSEGIRTAILQAKIRESAKFDFFTLIRVQAAVF